ncbi:hypothetical protein GQ42DRAFT_119924 [Ramicandelaber brevisporus]|nr:hypothetical protein GQ42DRAFT_119924 [Ramicandelaber brevisporus]
MDTAENANLFLAACKLIDLLLVLETDEFQIHQWIFSTDSMDALLGRPSLAQQQQQRSWARRSHRDMDAVGSLSTNSPMTAMLDRLADLLMLLPRPATASTSATSTDSADHGHMRRPFLSMKNVSSVRQLEPFVHSVSLHVYQNSTALARPDSDAIERLLEQDLMHFEYRTDGDTAQPTTN